MCLYQYSYINNNFHSSKHINKYIERQKVNYRIVQYAVISISPSAETVICVGSLVSIKQVVLSI